MTFWKQASSTIAAALLSAGGSVAAAGEKPFSATPMGAATYSGHQGNVEIVIEEGQKKEIVTVVGDMPVGSNVGFHSPKCAASREYAAGDAFLDFPGHKHDIVNVGDEPAQFVVTFLLEEGEEPLHPVSDPGRGNCQAEQ